MTRQEFLAWETASRDTIDVKRCYIDLAGDLVAGILLSQIVYWHLPGKRGAEKLQVEKDGVLWLAKGRTDWWDECRITAKQYDRAAEMLQSKGLVECKVMRFDGSPTVHVRLLWENFLRDLALLAMQVRGGNMDVPQMSKTEIPQRGKTPSPKGKNDVPVSGNSLTETPAETTQRQQQRAAPAAPGEGVVVSSQREERKEPDRPGAGFEAFKVKQAALREQTRRKLMGIGSMGIGSGKAQEDVPGREAPPVGEITDRLAALFTPEEGARWLTAPNAALGGEAPEALIRRGEGGRVLRLLIRLEEGVTT